MGCGAVCETQAPRSLKHNQHSQQQILKLIPSLSHHHPLLPQSHLALFTASLRSSIRSHVLPVGAKVSPHEQLPEAVQQKWKMMLYGLDKGDYVYRRSVGFGGDEKQGVTNSKELPQNKSNSESGPTDANTQYHSCFGQIEKDLTRTFDFKLHTRNLFEAVLKRISNHFPKMGYTQGVNFVVGYLLLSGYDANDAFWLFVHLVMNRRFLLLGLYEDGFPLANIYTNIFKNMLKRLDGTLHNHIYNNLMLDEAMWIFKWFITCFIYSFPLEVVKYVWDVVVERGGLGLVYLAVSIVIGLKDILLSSDDSCEVSQFLQELKNLSTFNQHLKIDKIMEKSYQLELKLQDLSGIEQLRPSFYKDYFKSMKNDLLPELSVPPLPKHKKVNKTKEDKLTHQLHTWYLKLLEERLEFISKNQNQNLEEDKGNGRDEVPSQIKEEDYMEMQKSLKILQDIVIQNQSVKYSQKNVEEQQGQNKNNNNDYFVDLAINQPLQGLRPPKLNPNPNQRQRIPVNISETDLELDNPNRLMTKISYDIAQQIDQRDEYSDSNNEDYQVSQHFTNSRIGKAPSNDLPYNNSQEPSIQLDPPSTRRSNLHANHSNELFHVNSLMNSMDNQRRKPQRQAPLKANNIPINPTNLRTGFSLAGQNILSNLSVTNSQHSSIDSKNTYKQKKCKENNLPRYNKNNKVRTQAMSQKSGPSNELSSQRQSSIQKVTDKDSCSNFTHRDRPNIIDKQDCLSRRTQQQLMVISHGPDKVNTSILQKDPVSQIQLFNGQGLFKKKKRKYNRDSMGMTLNQNANKMPCEVQQKRTINDQESLQSVLELSTCRKPRPRPSEEMLYQLQSIK